MGDALEGIRGMLLASAALRVALLLYGEWQDAHMEVRYTDVDYLVFSDAAALVASGKSPFERSTYRYSPLLAFLLVPNSLIHHCWGKVLFSTADLLVGVFINVILRQRNVPVTLCRYSVATWLFNPFTFTIGTRGNCEPLVCAMVLWVIISLMNGKVLQAAFWYGIVVHFRVYPIIYSLPILLILNGSNIQLGQRLVKLYSYAHTVNNQHSRDKVPGLQIIFKPLLLERSLFTWERILFSLLSGSVFLILTAIFFHIYGWEFLHEALLYHLTRVDPRHNFSIYFYHIYLHHQSEYSIVEKLAAFLPQLMVQMVLVFCFAQDLPFCFFVQTVAFVAFNKVITAQYFVWFFCLLPLILPWSKMKIKGRGLVCVAVWMMAQVHWLMWAYLLEFKGRNVFVQLWLCSIMFLAANTFVLMNVISHHTYAPLFVPIHRQPTANARKIH